MNVELEYKEISKESLKQMIHRIAKRTLIPMHYFDSDAIKFKNNLSSYNILKNELIKKHCEY